MQFGPSGAKLIQMTLISESVNGSVSQPLTVICHHFCLQNGSILHRDKKKLKAQIIVFIIRSLRIYHALCISASSGWFILALLQPIGYHCEGINPYKHWSNVQSASRKARLHIQCSQTDKKGGKKLPFLHFLPLAIWNKVTKQQFKVKLFKILCYNRSRRCMTNILSSNVFFSFFPLVKKWISCTSHG